VRTIEAVFEYRSRTDVLRVTPIFDLHWGSAWCDEGRFRRKVQEIKADPNHYWGLGGDVCEFITRKDNRFGGEHELAPWLQKKKDIIARSIDSFLSEVDCIKDKCRFLCLGNHGWYISYAMDKDGYRDIVQGITGVEEVENCPIAIGMEGFVVCRFKRKKRTGNSDGWTVVLYVHHGYGGGRLAGSHALTMQRTLKDFECDIALMGHRHINNYVANTKIMPSPKADETRARPQGGFFCGTYRDVLADTVEVDYTTRAGYPYSRSQGVELVFTPDKHRAQVVLDII
jgi:hypothetical protein